MIRTDDFVFLHPPKTGGTFVGAMIRHLLDQGRRIDAPMFARFPEYREL